ncbi:MAG: hypothetical protein ABEJ99_04540 [Candidatus Nanohaloarchaea archaeon]
MNKLIIATLLIVSLIGGAAASPADLTVFPHESSTRIDSFTSYQVNVQNSGPVKDVYTLSSSNPSEVSIAPTRVTLEPGAEETVNVWYNPEINKEAGTYSFSVIATSRATGKDYSVDGVVNVIKEHRVALDLDSASKTGCVSGKTNYRVSVTNNGIQKEEFKLTTDYGKLSQDKVTLEDGETQNVTLTVNSDKPVQKNFNVVAASTTSYAQDIQNIQFNAETCYASDVSISPETQDVNAFNPATFDVTVRNTGTKADDFVLSTSSGALSDNKLSIDGKSSKTVTLKTVPKTLGQKSVKVTAKSSVTSSATARYNVQNGMNAEISFSSGPVNVCEDQVKTVNAGIDNTGAAKGKFNLQTNYGELGSKSVVVDEGDSKDVGVKVNGSAFEPGTYTMTVTATAATFGNPVVKNTKKFTVENCWDLDMQVVPKVASAGENRSTIYEIRLKNTGSRKNTYQLAYEGPEWVSIKPDTIEVKPGQMKKAYMYAGIPFQKKGVVDITATAVGHEAKDSEKVKLVIGKDIEEAIKSDKGGLTGAFSKQISDFMNGLSGSNGSKIAVSIVVGLIVTSIVLYREW